MLNYLKAELYKACRRKYLRILLAVMLALESLFALLWTGSNDFAYMVTLMTTTMSLGTFLAVLLADVVASEPGKTGTLKNETAFGITRSGIYLGKLFAAVIVALLFCAILFGWYLGGCWLFFGHSDMEAVRVSLGVLGYVALASLPLWMGTLALSHALYMNLKSEFAGAAIVYLLFTVGVGFLSTLAIMKLGMVAQIAAFLADLIPVIPIDQYRGALTRELMTRNWAIGLGWVVCASAVGIAFFKRREIK